MPWTKRQQDVFRALEHGWEPKSVSLRDLAKLGKKKLGEMASEGTIKSKPKGKR